MELLNIYKTDNIRKKSYLFVGIIFFLFLVLILRLWFIQVIQGDEMRIMAENNRVHVRSIPNYRGNILDRNHQIIVSMRPSFNLYLTRENVTDLPRELQFIKESVDLTGPNTLKEIKSYPAHKELLLKRDVSRKEIAVIEENGIDLSGFSIKVEPMRDYKFGRMASQTLGYLGEIGRKQLESIHDGSYRPGDFIGKYGLEKRFETLLRGKKGKKSVEVDAAGRELRILRQVDPVPGRNLVLTIDKELQEIVEHEMRGHNGAVVVLDPRNGDILAITSKPSFDPNLFARGISHKEWTSLLLDKDHPLQNRAISGLYPPGSTYKMVLAAAGLEKGIITEDSTYFCPGYFRLGRRKYRCWKRGGHGKMNLHRALVQSCDVFFYQLGYHLGIDTIAEYARGFGLGAVTGFDRENEKSGVIPTQAWKLRAKKEPWQPGETISASIGQGYNVVTPLQLANMIAALGNGGKLFKPNIVKYELTPNGEIIGRNRPTLIGRLPVSPETLEIIRNALRGVCQEKRGTGWRARVPGIEVAGKTGTAQVVRRKEANEVNRKEETPLKFRDHALFLAFAPYENPELAVAVIVEHGGHGGSTSAPIAQKIFQAALSKKRSGQSGGI